MQQTTVIDVTVIATGADGTRQRRTFESVKEMEVKDGKIIISTEAGKLELDGDWIKVEGHRKA